MMQETKRLFIGIPITQDLIVHFMSIKESAYILNMDRALRWVKPENLHLTLIFLGDTSFSLIKPISEIMNLVCNQKVFELDYQKIGCFPNLTNPRVLWVGIYDPSNLQILYNRLIRGLNKILELKHARFSPHITLARIPQYVKPEIIREINNLVIKNQSLKFGIQKVDKIVLFESQLGKNGPIYKIIHQSMLK